jgi:hypothetical protein
VILFRRKRRNLPPPQQPRPSEGERARKRAEQALAEVRARAEQQRPLREWFRWRFEENGFGEEVDTLWGGKL